MSKSSFPERSLVVIRPLYDLLGSVVQSRMQMEGIKAQILLDMSRGEKPTHRGVPWGVRMFDALHLASTTIEITFSVLKGVQFPETLEDRMVEAQDQLTRYLNNPSSR